MSDKDKAVSVETSSGIVDAEETNRDRAKSERVAREDEC